MDADSECQQSSVSGPLQRSFSAESRQSTPPDNLSNDVDVEPEDNALDISLVK